MSGFYLNQHLCVYIPDLYAFQFFILIKSCIKYAYMMESNNLVIIKQNPAAFVELVTLVVNWI